MPSRWRSKGCRACVSKRVKCDQTLPHCLRCQRKNIVCDGPASRGSRFVDETPGIKSKYSSETPPLDSSNVHSDRQPNRHASSTETMSKAPASYSEDVYYTFFITTYFNTDTWKTETDYQANKLWMHACVQSPSEYPVSNLAMRCLMTGYFGGAHRSTSLQGVARTLYRADLSLLRKDLADPVKCGTFDVLAASCLLTIYEYTALTSAKAWLEHLRGISALFEMSGSSCFRKYPQRSLFIFMRQNILLGSMSRQERTFLEKDEWQDILDSDNEINLQTLRLQDVCARVPGLMKDVQQLENDRNSAVAPCHLRTAAEIILAWVRLQEDLKSWYWQWTTLMPYHLPIVVPPATDPQEGLTHSFDEILWYSDFDVASSLCQYHALMILTHRWLHRLVGEQSLSETHCSEVREHAISICKSIPYLLSSEHAHTGAFHLLFPAYTACKALSLRQHERVWLIQILNSIADDKGIAIARYLAGEAERRRAGDVDDSHQQVSIAPSERNLDLPRMDVAAAG